MGRMPTTKPVDLEKSEVVIPPQLNQVIPMDKKLPINTNKTPEGILVRFKDLICLKIGIDQASGLRTLVDRFITINAKGKATSSAHYEKVNTLSELTKENKMTIKVFFKFLKIIRARKINITMTVTGYDGRDYTVSDDFNLTVTDDSDNV